MTQRMLLIAVLVAATLVPATAAVDLMCGSDSYIELMPAIYLRNAQGNQDWVRQFDGRRFGFGAIEGLDIYGYNGPLQYWVEGTDLFNVDDDFSFTLMHSNKGALSFYQSVLTHRLAPTPEINPWLAGTPAAGGDDIIDLSPGQNYATERRVNSIYLRATPGSDQRQRIALTWWQEAEAGSRQLLFRARQNKAPIVNRTRYGVGIPVNRETTEFGIGPDIKIGTAAVINYRFNATHYRDDAGLPAPGSALDFLPLNSLTRFKAQTKSNIVKARATITDQLYFTGALINRDRENTAATLVDHVGVRLNSSNANLTYLATPSLSFTARFRHYDMDNRVDELLSSGGEPQNQQLSHELQSEQFEAVFTGVPRLYVRGGFERRDEDRSFRPVHGIHEEFDHPLTSENTRSNIWRASVRYYPTSRLSMSARFEDWGISGPGYMAAPTDRTRLNVNATYLIRDNFAVYGDFSQSDEKNTNIFVPFGDIPTPATDVAGEELRREAAGQGYDTDSSNTVVGAWYAICPRLVFDASYANIGWDASTLFIIGESPAYPPHLLPNVARYTADSIQWAVGATFTLNPKTRVYGRFTNASSKGANLLNTAAYPAGIPPVWQPVSVNEKRYTVGFGYDLSAKDSLQADVSFSDWMDRIDPANDGTFTVWRLAYTRQF